MTTLTPTLSSLVPDSYPQDDSNQSMQLFGSNFVSGDTLTFTDPQGDVIAIAASNLSVAAGSVIFYQFNDGNDAGTWSVEVNSPDGTAHSSAVSFTVTAPTLSFVSPTSYATSAGNQSMELFGSNFASGDTLTFTDPQGDVIAIAASNLTVAAGSVIFYQFNDGNDAGTWSVQVNGPNGSATSAQTFSVVVVPGLVSVSPTVYAANANPHTMQLFGSEFQSGDTLTFTDPQGDVIASTASNLTVVSSGEIDYQFNDGSDAGSWSVKVNNPNGSSSADFFTVGAPVLGSLTPTLYTANDSIYFMQLSGSNFASGDTLTFTDPQGDVIASTASDLTVASGMIDYLFNDGGDPGTWSVQVNSSDGTLHSGADTFSVVEVVPVLSEAEPGVFRANASNQMLQLFGNNFESGDTLTFTDPQGDVIAGTASNLTVFNGTLIEYQFNDGGDAGAWSVQVNSSSGSFHSSPVSFSAELVPTLSSVSPTLITGDANSHTMQLFGNFQNGDTLSFTGPQGQVIASTASNLTFVSSGEIDYKFNDGSDAGTWSVQVDSPSGAFQSSANTFTVPPAGDTTLIVGSGSGIIFDNTFTANCTQAYINAVVAAENTIRGLWTNSVTLNLEFNAAAEGTGSDSFLSENSWSSINVTYAQLKSALASHGFSFDAQTAASFLPSSDPNPEGGADWSLPEAYARMLGLSTGTPAIDDTITLNTSYNWSYGQDVTNAIEHEISEGAMGRVGGLGDQNDSWSTMDLFRYSASGVPDYRDGRDGVTTYFSYNGGSTSSSSAGLSFNNEFNVSGTQVNQGDTADFTQQDVFGTGSPGETNTLSQTDLEMMDVLGWDPAAPYNFAGHGTSDVLFRNDANGDTGFYAINNGVNTGWKDVGASSTAYSVVGTGDFYGTGTTDILYRDAGNGDTGFYQISNGANVGWHDIGASSTAYSVVGVGDFTGNDTDDVLFRDNANGDTGFYTISNGVNTGWHDVGASSTAYSVVGVGDFMGNGTDDILFRDNANGDTGFYDIVNGVNTGWHDIGASSTAYSVVGTGDYLGTGSSDVLFRNNTNGDTGFYAISNGVNTGWHDVGASSTAYHVAG